VRSHYAVFMRGSLRYHASVSAYPSTVLHSTVMPHVPHPEYRLVHFLLILLSITIFFDHAAQLLLKGVTLRCRLDSRSTTSVFH
jgi:hypothetical protein